MAEDGRQWMDAVLALIDRWNDGARADGMLPGIGAQAVIQAMRVLRDVGAPVIDRRSTSPEALGAAMALWNKAATRADAAKAMGMSLIRASAAATRGRAKGLPFKRFDRGLPSRCGAASLERAAIMLRVGLESDTDLALVAGVDRSTVGDWRRAAGIPAFRRRS